MVYVDVDDEIESVESAMVGYDRKLLGSMLVLIAVFLMAILSMYMYFVFGPNIYIQAAMVLGCIVCVIGPLKLLFTWMDYCIRSKYADNPDCYFKVEITGWFMYFTINGSIATLSLYGYYHPFGARGVGDFFYLFLTSVCSALFVLGLLKLFLDYLIEHKSRQIRLPRNHPARKHPERRRQLCEDIVNWFVFFIIMGFLGLVSWKNYNILFASGDYPETTKCFRYLTLFFGFTVIGGLWAIYCGVVGFRTKWRDEDNLPAHKKKYMVVKRLLQAKDSVSINPQTISQKN